jgi:predicted RNase H-like HicB family nuclease
MIGFVRFLSRAQFGLDGLKIRRGSNPVSVSLPSFDIAQDKFANRRIPTSGTKSFIDDSREVKNMKKYLLQVVVEQDEDGMYIADCPALEGCYTQGKTFEEAMKNIKDVIQMCLEELKGEKKKVDLKYPEVIGTKWIEVTI